MDNGMDDEMVDAMDDMMDDVMASESVVPLEMSLVCTMEGGWNWVRVCGPCWA
jgi:hypothetical protein